MWADNAGTHGYKKEHHMRTKGKDGIHSTNDNIWSLYDSLLIIKVTNIWLIILKFGKGIASIICYVKNRKFWKNSSIVANYRIFWDDLYMHQVMLNINVSHSGRNTSMISYGSWGMSSYHIDTVFGDIDMKAWKLC